DNIVLEARDHETIKNTHRAGILETGAVEMLTNYGVDSRVTKIGYEHGGIDLRFDGESHRINFKELVDASVCYIRKTKSSSTLPQHVPAITVTCAINTPSLTSQTSKPPNQKSTSPMMQVSPAPSKPIL